MPKIKLPRPQYHLPTGEYTFKAKEYYKAWEDLAKPIEKAIGARLCAYDPGLMFLFNTNQSFTLPVNVVQLLNKALARNNNVD